MKTKTLLILLLFLSPLIANILLNPVQATFYQSTYESATPRESWQQGARLIAHDANTLTQVNYYAVLYSNLDGDLNLNAYWYLGNSIVLTQEIASYDEWAGNETCCYAVSNVINSRFYIAYKVSYNTLIIRSVLFNYTSSYIFTNFEVSVIHSYQSNDIIYESGFDIMQTPDGNIWFTYVSQTDTLNVEVWKITNYAIVASTRIVTSSWENWSAQLARISNQVYVWTYPNGFGNTGSLYFANNGTKILDSSAYAEYSSTISLTNNTIAIVYSYADTSAYVRCIMYASLSVYKDSVVPFAYAPYLSSLSTFAMPNGYMGFFYTDHLGLNIMYHSQNVSTPTRWSWTAQLIAHRNPAVVFSQDQVYADPDATLITYPAHPTAWVYASFDLTPYWSLISVDFSNTNNISYSTQYSTSQVTQYWTYISITTSYTSTTTVLTTHTVSASLIQSGTFLANSVILVLFILVPAGIFGVFLKILGFTFGAMLGASAAFAFGQIPLWLMLMILLLMSLMLLSIRSVSNNDEA